jgi:hypothetical protein
MVDAHDPPSVPSKPGSRTLDTKTIEVLALAVFRTLFGRGIRVPIKREGMVDLDLMVQDNNIVLNLNRVELHAPELLIWRMIFAYQGKPVVEYGRGIKNDMKIHWPQLLILFLHIWRDKRLKRRTRIADDAARDQEMVARVSVPGPSIPAAEGTRI